MSSAEGEVADPIVFTAGGGLDRPAADDSRFSSLSLRSKGGTPTASWRWSGFR
jgi:hypothetical protein